jgi:hypothetical protein
MVAYAPCFWSLKIIELLNGSVKAAFPVYWRVNFKYDFFHACIWLRNFDVIIFGAKLQSFEANIAAMYKTSHFYVQGL